MREAMIVRLNISVSKRLLILSPACSLHNPIIIRHTLPHTLSRRGARPYLLCGHVDTFTRSCPVTVITVTIIIIINSVPGGVAEFVDAHSKRRVFPATSVV